MVVIGIEVVPEFWERMKSPKESMRRKDKGKWKANISVNRERGTKKKNRKKGHRGSLVAQSVKCLTLDFCSGHDLTMVCGSNPTWGSALSTQGLLGILSLSLRFFLLVHTQALQNKL